MDSKEVGLNIYLKKTKAKEIVKNRKRRRRKEQRRQLMIMTMKLLGVSNI